MTLYRHVDGCDDWEEHAELDKHVETEGGYDLRHSYATESMPDGVILIRDIGGDVYSFMVPVEPCDHGKYDAHHTEYHPLKDRSLDGHMCQGAGLKDET